MTSFRSFLFLIFITVLPVQAQEMDLNWQPRQDLNINLPNSVKIFDAVGSLPDGNPLRAMYAEIDLSDKNLKFRSIGSNSIRETTKETYVKSDGILAINGGYFADKASVSAIIQDGEVVAPGPDGEVTRGAFGMKSGKPEIAWINAGEDGIPKKFSQPDISSNAEVWEVSQAVGGGPVLLKNGEVEVTDKEEGFGGSHLQRHPRSAIGYKDENTLIMLVVDGRQDASAGVTLPELAEILYEIGAKEAVNLDGGGSSAMVAADEVVNIPSDITGGNRNSLRNNAGALVISEEVPSEKPKNLIFDTESKNYSETGIWKSSNQVNYYGATPSRIATSNQLNKASYSFKGLQRNNYQLGVWFTVNTSENVEKVNYVLHSEEKTDTISIDQSALKNLGKWNILGDFEIGPEDSLEIMGASEGKFIADAIRLVAKKDSPELPKRGDTRIAVISDLNSGLGAADYEWQVDSIIKRIPKIWAPDLVISGGDMVAGMGISRTEQLQKMWDGFTKHIAEPLKNAQIPFAFTLGNHDGPRSYPVEHKFARDFWRNSANKPDLNFVDDSHFPNYYSFLQNDIFFVSWEASSPKITAENLKWLEEQFQTEAAKNAKLRFVIGHMPLYSVAQERDSKGNVLENPENLQKLLEEYGVHTYISGHQHAYYPGKRGRLQLLNTGAAGSGARSWLTSTKKPVNTITIMDVFHKGDSIVYSTYDIKKEKAGEMPLFDEKTLPSAMFGVNGHMLRKDIPKAKSAQGFLSSLHTEENNISGIGHVNVEIEKNKLKISGAFFNLEGALSEENPIGVYKGRHTENGGILKEIKLKNFSRGSGKFEGTIKLNKNIQDFLDVGALYMEVKTEAGSIRAQLYPETNTAPPKTQITSHSEKNTYGIRDIEALYEVNWEDVIDDDGDFVSYSYQLSKTQDFSEVVFEQKTGRENSLKITEEEWYDLLGNTKIGEKTELYHRVLATDGSHSSASETQKLSLMKSDEVLDDFAEVLPPNYVYKGKIEAAGAGYGAEWDAEGKLWLSDYSRGFIIQNKEGEAVDFSPLTSVEFEGEKINLKPVTGLGVDNDGNILAGINNKLIKIDSQTGKAIALWKAPEGKRAITDPRASENDEIYVMSLFADDPNYVLKQDGADFEVVRTLELENRNLSRAFEMSKDGKTLYFPDPGSPKIQVYTSENGEEYEQQKDISSISAGSSALQVRGNGLYAAVRSSGVSASAFHYRNEKKQQMWSLELPEVNGAEPRGIGVSPDEKSLIFCSWDKGGGYYLFELEE